MSLSLVGDEQAESNLEKREEDEALHSGFGECLDEMRLDLSRWMDSTSLYNLLP